jgi:hypothetical protein
MHPAVPSGAPGNWRAFPVSERRPCQPDRVHRTFLSGAESQPMFCRRNLVLVVLLCVSVAVSLGHVRTTLNDMLRNLPDSFDATDVSFVRSFANGFGPGANETGFAVINLSDTRARRIAWRYSLAECPTRRSA